MSFYKGFASRINSLRYSCEGSFFVCATIMLPVIFIAIGMALDISSWMYYRNSLKQASHTTILAASTELSESLKGLFSGKVAIRDIQQYAKRYLEGTLVSDFSKEDINKIIRSLEINIEKDKDNTSGAYIIQLHSHYDMSLNSFSWAMHAIGIHSIGVDVVVKGYARPESSHKEMAASIQMVIDVSGSMGFPQYIENESQQPILLNCYGIPYPKMP
ncbi:hypothetical protein, partial [Candidatus Liberibacter sp.]|uniref:hypothetical protein n=1 Tax=Candidatus Liberibacter sp. TaxID=34022 RepID=UPI0015F4FE07